MPLIKYYTKNTCYDGRKDFIKTISTENNVERFYPDEYLIANILQQYVHSLPASNKKIVVLTEPWSAAINSRDGGKNTTQINEFVINQINSIIKKQGETLILVPFLFGYHHPGMTIDLKNKKAIYLDPYGGWPKFIETSVLVEQLQDIGFSVEAVQTKQQSDGVSCGPILTASMIKFIDEFLKDGKITAKGFNESRADLASIRIHQMLINNADKTDGKPKLINEIMLADESLWRDFFIEKKVDKSLIEPTIAIIKNQKNYIKSLDENWASNVRLKTRVFFIRDIQTKIAELVFAENSQKNSQLINLINLINQLLKTPIKQVDVKLNNTPNLSQTTTAKNTPIALKEKKQPSIIGATIGLLFVGTSAAYYGGQWGMGVGSAILPGFGTVAGAIVGGFGGWVIGIFAGVLIGDLVDFGLRALGRIVKNWIAPQGTKVNEQASKPSNDSLVETMTKNSGLQEPRFKQDVSVTGEQVYYPPLFHRYSENEEIENDNSEVEDQHPKLHH